MAPRTARWILWITLVLTVPVPFWMVLTGSMPAARLLMLSGVGLAILLTEGTQGVVGTVTALLLGQALAALGIFWVVAALIARLLRTQSRARIAAVTLALVAVCAITASAFELYRTPFRADSPRANLAHVFD